MPRKTRRQLVGGKQEDIDRQEREEGLRALAHELHSQWREIIHQPTEPGDTPVSLPQAKTMLLTAPVGTGNSKNRGL